LSSKAKNLFTINNYSIESTTVVAEQADKKENMFDFHGNKNSTLFVFQVSGK